jgi:hypothetical protein
MQQQKSCLLTSDGSVGRLQMMQQVGYIRTNTDNSILGRCDTGTNGSGKNWQLATSLLIDVKTAYIEMRRQRDDRAIGQP